LASLHVVCHVSISQYCHVVNVGAFGGVTSAASAGHATKSFRSTSFAGECLFLLNREYLWTFGVSVSHESAQRKASYVPYVL